MDHKFYLGDNLPILQKHIPDESVDLIYIDPPFNTGKTHKYREREYDDKFESLQDYLRFIRPRLEEGHRILKPNGSFFLHIDYRAVHYCKMVMDTIFGSESFKNEIIWAYDFGARQKDKWATKHDNILWYAKNPKDYTYNYDRLERVPYLSTMRQDDERLGVGKTLTDVWWCSIIHTNSKERVGYPTQKPLKILNRIVQIHSKPNDVLMDYFAGSGSFGESAAMHNRQSILIDRNPDVVEIIQNRLGLFGVEIMEVE